MKKLLVVLLALVAFVAGMFVSPLAEQVTKRMRYKDMTNEQALQALVDDAKEKVTLPHKNDDNITLVDLRADADEMAIVYQLEVHGLSVEDRAKVKKSLKDSVMNMCGQPDADSAMKNGLHFKWIHHFTEEDKVFTTTLFASDCEAAKQAKSEN